METKRNVSLRGKDEGGGEGGCCNDVSLTQVLCLVNKHSSRQSQSLEEDVGPSAGPGACTKRGQCFIFIVNSLRRSSLGGVLTPQSAGFQHPSPLQSFSPPDAVDCRLSRAVQIKIDLATCRIV
ncbi:hypothetical protein RRG08_028286 [Elysia crispata]|uniref:Uncharacterized protein n=1 Tax=Elysia crispata TaxID=231223 RepID=A0AAE1AW55_9GAST|nr:hypothetical protein RRG08_028286 [Elysia crispata]